MNILLNGLSPEPLPPIRYGGAERMQSYLVKGLREIGYDPVLLCREGSSIDCKTVMFPDYPGDAAQLLTQAEAQFGDFDIIHDSMGSNTLFDAFARTHPVIRTVHGPATQELTIYLSQAMGTPYTDLGIDLSFYTPCYEKEDYVVFMGQARRGIKHLHYLTAVAKHFGLRAVVIAPAANSDMDYVWECFNDYPFAWINGADDYTKALYIRKAKCMIHCSENVTWQDCAPGAVLESLALGTPVIGNYSGGIPGMVIDGVTGFLVNSENEAIEAYGKIGQIRPEACRGYMEEHRTHTLFAKRTAVIYEALQNMGYPDRCVKMQQLQTAINEVG
jgi:hypothetical protein